MKKWGKTISCNEKVEKTAITYKLTKLNAWIEDLVTHLLLSSRLALEQHIQPWIIKAQ